MLYNNSRPLVVYLNRRGCLEYTVASIKSIVVRDPVLLVGHAHLGYFRQKFPELDILSIPMADTVLGLLFGFLSFRSRVLTIISESTVGQLFLPAFHPYNAALVRMMDQHGSPSTITIHDYLTHTGERSIVIETIQKLSIKMAARVNFLSEYVRHQAIADMGERHSFHVVPHPILESYAHNTLPYNPRPNILCIGRMVTYKGIDLLLEAIRGLEINKLTIAGDNLGIVLPQQENVEYIARYLSESELAELLDTHEILVLPYREASQSGILTLGIDAQMVMVISKVGGLPEQLAHDEVVWVEPTVECLRAGIHSLISDASFYDMIKRSIQHKKHLGSQ